MPYEVFYYIATIAIIVSWISYFKDKEGTIYICSSRTALVLFGLLILYHIIS